MRQSPRRSLCNDKLMEESSDKLSKKKLVGRIITLLVLLFVFCAIGFYVWLGYQFKKGADAVLKEADDGFKKARVTIDPEKLRAWALEDISKKQNTNTNRSDSKIPIYIQNLYSDPPEDFTVNTNCVTIYWGGGFFHWMIDIGSTNFVEATGIHDISTTIEWVPGIYYSRENIRHPFK